MTPHAHETTFDLHELFVSTTDRKGRILMANDVFVRVSGYAREDLTGRPHNIIRHPDMPRGVFKVLWERLEADAPVAAYVKNRAEDGSFYWVMAIVVPVPDGYLSVRLKPTSSLFATARSLYTELRALEEEIEGDDPRQRKPSIEAGRERLMARLAELGFDDYDAFMRVAFAAEVEAREAQLGKAAAPAGDAVADAAAATLGFLRGIRDRLARYGELSETLRQKSGFVVELAESIRLFSLNSILAAARLEDGAALGAVAGLLRARGAAATPEIDALGVEIAQVGQLLGEASFRAAAAAVQAEMLGAFVQDELEASAQRELVAGAVQQATEAVTASLRALDDGLDRLAGHAAAVGRHLGVIRALQVNGRIEAARSRDTEQVRALFEEIAKQVEAASQEITFFTGVGARGDRGLEREAQERAAQIRRAIATLA